jgi:serine/threonine protein kinase/Tol biopolymer transport system component
MHDPDRWTQIDRLLDAALDRPGGERAAFLAKACVGDEELRREVESLLAAHDEAENNFLQIPALEVAAQGLSAGMDRSLLGRTIGHYSVISVLGVGGMGEVYLARDTILERKVALKLLPPQYTSDPNRISRFEREARAASALNHPNIITIYEIGEIEGKHFIAAEFVDGRTLRELLADGRIAIKDAIEIAIQIAGALSTAHEAGIVHRDIKPENIILRRDGYVKVLDFGLVKLTERRRSSGATNGSKGDLAKTNPGVVLGTARYMSPEQALGQEVDSRSDIFSLGVVLYELITGVPPFKGDSTASVLDAVVHHHPLPVRKAREDAPDELQRLIMRSLEKDREMRYQTAGDMRAELKRLLREIDSSPSHLINSGEHDRPPVSKTRRLITAAVIIALMTAGFSLWWLYFREAPAASPWLNAYVTQVTDLPGEESNPSLSPDARSVYYARRVNDQWDVFVQRAGGANAQNLTKDFDGDNDQPACSPDGSRVVFRSARNGGGLYVMGATGESPRKISDFGQNPAWSPDGTEIVCGTDYILDPKRRISESKLWVINVGNGEKRPLITEGDAAQPRWSPNGHRIAYFFRTAAGRRDIWTVPAKGGQPVPLTDDAALDWNPVWSPDGNYLYFASDRQGIASLWRVRIDEMTGGRLGDPEAVTGPVAEILQIDISRDGRRIVYTTRVQFANLQTIGFDPVKKITIGQPSWITQGSRPSGSPNISPDGQFVAFHSLGAAQEDIWLIRSDGAGSITNLTNDHEIDRLPRWSPDGNRLAFYSNRTGKSQIWIVNRDGSGKQQITFGERGTATPFWSPKGRHLGYAFTNNGGGTQIIDVDQPWDRQTPLTLPPVNADGDWFNGWLWSPDGKLIAGTVGGVRGKESRGLVGVHIYSLETQSYEKITDSGSRPEWLNDSRHFIYIDVNKNSGGEISLADSRTKKTRVIASMPPFVISSVGISPDNRRLIYTATDHQADIYMLSLD